MMDDQMDGEQPPSVFYPPASAFGLFASAPYSVVGYPPDAQPDPVARKRERDIFPLMPEEAIINGQAIKKLRINQSSTPTPPGHGVLVPPSPSASPFMSSIYSASSSSSSSGASSVLSPHQGCRAAASGPSCCDPAASDHDWHAAGEHLSPHYPAHNPNEGPCGPALSLGGPLPPLCRSYSEPTRRTPGSPIAAFGLDGGVDDTDVNYSIINQMLRILHFERRGSSPYGPEEPDFTDGMGDP